MRGRAVELPGQRSAVPGSGGAMTALLLSLGLLVWPSTPQLPATLPRPGRRRFPMAASIGPAAAPGIGLLVGLVSSVPAGSTSVGVAGSVLGVTVGWLVRSGLAARRRRRTSLETLQAIRALAREINAGSDLETAVTAMRASAGPVVSAMLGGLLAGGAPMGAGARDVGAALAAAVALSRRVGVPLAGLLDRLAEGLAEQRHAAEQRASAVAGARLSGWVLAGLPVMGVLLGAGMGADPIPVLLSGGVGGVLLVVGTTLSCAGLLWSARIARAPG